MPRLVNLQRMPARSERPAELEPWEPKERDRAILNLLLEYRYLTPEFAAILYEHDRGRGRWHVQHQLTKLYRYGYAERFYQPAETGSNQYVYTVSVEGARLLIEPEEWPSMRRKVYNLAKPKANYKHPLDVSLLRILWMAGAPSQDRLFSVKEFWTDKEGWKDRTVNRFVARVGSEDVPVLPDTTVLIHHDDGYFRPYFFEIERSHKNKDRLRERLQSYIWLLTNVRGQHEIDRVFYAQTNIRPSTGFVVFVGVDVGHAERLRETAALLVGETGLKRKERPQMWFTSIDRFFREDLVRDSAGNPKKDRRGRVCRRQYVIEPEDFFRVDLFTNLDGNPGHLVV